MITKIKLNNVATFTEETEFSPDKVNYIYGFNGSGKTTISNVLKKTSNYLNCNIEGLDELEVLTYNKDFVDELFTDTSKVKGIFTLGKDADDARKKIENYEEEKNKLIKDNEVLNNNIEKKKEELNKIKEKLKDDCWRVKDKYYNDFKEAMKGTLSKKIDFAKKCLSIKLNKANLKSFEQLKKEYNELFKSSLQKRDNIEKLDFDEIFKIESNLIFNKVIKGNDKLTISDLINKLNNSDWVKDGMQYIKNSNNKCPFCQQTLPNYINQLAEYFNKEYKTDCANLSNLYTKYKNLSTNIIEQIRGIEKLEYIENKLELNNCELKFKGIVDSNMSKIEDKIKNPSILIKLENSSEVLIKINKSIDNINNSNKEYNLKIDNINLTKKTLIADVWNVISNELEADIREYKTNISNCNKALEPMKEKIIKNITRIEEIKKSIKEIKKTITGITAVLNDINKILQSFGFNSFKLIEGKENGTYRIVRNNGDDVGKTLSEGEYRFISFLYFYHLINGSNDSSGLTKDKIIVIDDPISSLDSNSLFIVSTLTKNIINECFNDKNGIKQVFIMTHNIYFYKEVLFRGNRKNKKNCEKYFVLSKKNEISKIKEYEKSPINTTYELLWDELRQEEKNKSTIYNTMRRILEYYFNIIGGISYEKAINKFEGIEKTICNSLISCINDSSHYINEDINVVFDDDMLDKYLDVFKKIFENMGHISHYNMMMKLEEEYNG